MGSDDELFADDCLYINLNDIRKSPCPNLVHLNIRSLWNKQATLEVLLNELGLPPFVLLTETWLTCNSASVAILNYVTCISNRCYDSKVKRVVGLLFLLLIMLILF
jgi:hypothetical protein